MGRRCGRREPQRMASSVLAVLALAAAWQATGAQTVPEQDGCLPNISPACLAKLTIDTLGCACVARGASQLAEVEVRTFPFLHRAGGSV